MREAGFYSELSGLLAGFAVAALTVVLATRVGSQTNGDRSEMDRIAVALFASIIGLASTSMIAAEVSSSVDNGARTATGSSLIGVALTASGITLFYALALVMHHAGLSLAIKVGRWVSGFGAPVMGFEVMPQGSGQIDVLRRVHGHAVANASGFAHTLGLLLCIPLLASLLIRREFRFDRILQNAPIVASVVAVAAMMAEGVLMQEPLDYLLPTWADYLGIVIALSVFTFLGLAGTRVRLRPQHVRKGPHAQQNRTTGIASTPCSHPQSMVHPEKWIPFTRSTT